MHRRTRRRRRRRAGVASPRWGGRIAPQRAAWGGAGGSGAPDRHHPDGWGRIAPDSRPLGRAGGPGASICAGPLARSDRPRFALPGAAQAVQGGGAPTGAAKRIPPAAPQCCPRSAAHRHVFPFCRASSCGSPFGVKRMTGCFLLHRPIARRPTLAGRSAARGISTGVTSRGTPGRTRQAGQPVFSQVARRVVNPPASPPAAAAAERRDRRAKTNPPTRTHARRGAGLDPTLIFSAGRRPAPPRRATSAPPGDPGRFPGCFEGAQRAPRHRNGTFRSSSGSGPGPPHRRPLPDL
jgi:hypothetical protein